MFESLYEKEMIIGEAAPFELPAWISCAPFEEFLGMTIEEAKDGRAVLSMLFRLKHAQGKGLMHGGAVTALADTAVAIAIKTLLPEGTNFVTTEMSLKFHAAVSGGTVKAVANAVALDERSFSGTAEVFDQNGVKTATFTSIFKTPKNRPTT